jgi:hypothetical protein
VIAVSVVSRKIGCYGMARVFCQHEKRFFGIGSRLWNSSVMSTWKEQVVELSYPGLITSSEAMQAVEIPWPLLNME